MIFKIQNIRQWETVTPERREANGVSATMASAYCLGKVPWWNVGWNISRVWPMNSRWKYTVCLRPFQAAVAEFHRLWINNRNVFLEVLEAGKSKVKMLADTVSGESSLPCPEVAVFLLCPHVRELFGGLCYEGTNPIQESSDFMT